MPRDTIKYCVICDRELTEHQQRFHTKYCSDTCRHVSNNGPSLPISSGTMGAISELIAAADLMVRGYEVFRAVSQACSADLAILKDGRLVLIEVRTAKWNKARTQLNYSKVKMRADVYALVVEGEVVYKPPLENDK